MCTVWKVAIRSLWEQFLHLLIRYLCLEQFKVVHSSQFMINGYASDHKQQHGCERC